MLKYLYLKIILIIFILMIFIYFYFGKKQKNHFEGDYYYKGKYKGFYVGKNILTKFLQPKT